MITKSLSLIETEVAIKFIKDTFEKELAKALKLTRVSAPLFVFPESGLNDNLNGFERAVRFDILDLKKEVEIVQSLAKWKRMALAKYGFTENTGLYTDMNAIRRDETLDAIHSVYVDQWDWEKIITKEERKYSYLKKTVKSIYKALKTLAKKVNAKYPNIVHNLPEEITFITSKELEKLYPTLTRKERETAITKEKGAVFISQIGWNLSDGKPHDGRAADYDDWKLNGDVLLWDEPLGIALEISSMGIRVDEKSLVKQLKFKKELSKLENPYCQDVINGKLPLTIGGGIGQSRLCLYFLNKMHIGEVQASVWGEEAVKDYEKKGIKLL
ncbi:MAG: aspartate--ammonia ligase [Clostridia bacterium]|nr:aspartate--ammonia ligase [Clostridia bacterium]